MSSGKRPSNTTGATPPSEPMITNARIKCDSGLTGWLGRLRDQYADFDDWARSSDTYGLASRLEYANPEIAWEENPWIVGSVEPKDYRRAKEDEPPLVYRAQRAVVRAQILLANKPSDPNAIMLELNEAFGLLEIALHKEFDQ